MIGPLLTFKRRFVWQAREIVYLAKVSKTCGFLWQFQKRWQAWDIRTGSAKIHVAWQAQYKRHMSYRRLLDMLGGEGADFLRGAAFWSIGSSGLLR